jgi:hypothetical protein
MNNPDAIAEAEVRAARAEAAALETRIRLVIVQARLAELEAAATERRDAEAERAVRRMVSSGVIGKGDTFTAHAWKQKFLADPALVPLAIGKVFNQRKRVTT